jgi:hypothetical protein
MSAVPLRDTVDGLAGQFYGPYGPSKGRLRLLDTGRYSRPNIHVLTIEDAVTPLRGYMATPSKPPIWVMGLHPVLL